MSLHSAIDNRSGGVSEEVSRWFNRLSTLSAYVGEMGVCRVKLTNPGNEPDGWSD